MQIVIEIDEHSYNLICRFITGEGYKVLPTPITDRLFKEVVRGTPLPKGHGDLVSRNDVIHSLFDYVNGKKTIGECVDKVKAVIPADKEGGSGADRN